MLVHTLYFKVLLLANTIVHAANLDDPLLDVPSDKLSLSFLDILNLVHDTEDSVCGCTDDVGNKKLGDTEFVKLSDSSDLNLSSFVNVKKVKNILNVFLRLFSHFEAYDSMNLETFEKYHQEHNTTVNDIGKTLETMVYGKLSKNKMYNILKGLNWNQIEDVSVGKQFGWEREIPKMEEPNFNSVKESLLGKSPTKRPIIEDAETGKVLKSCSAGKASTESETRSKVLPAEQNAKSPILLGKYQNDDAVGSSNDISDILKFKKDTFEFMLLALENAKIYDDVVNIRTMVENLYNYYEDMYNSVEEQTGETPESEIEKTVKSGPIGKTVEINLDSSENEGAMNDENDSKGKNGEIPKEYLNKHSCKEFRKSNINKRNAGSTKAKKVKYDKINYKTEKKYNSEERLENKVKKLRRYNQPKVNKMHKSGTKK